MNTDNLPSTTAHQKPVEVSEIIPPCQTTPLDLTALPGVPELASRLMNLSQTEALQLLNELLDSLGGQTSLERLIHLHLVLANFQSLKILALADITNPVDYKNYYVNMYSRIQGVMRRWVSTLKTLNETGNKSVELIYTFNQLNLSPPPNEKNTVQNGRRFNNLKHGLRSELLDLPPKES